MAYASGTLLRLCLLWPIAPEMAPKKLCTAVRLAAVFMLSAPTPSAVGTYNSSGTITIPPPIPRSPDTNPPTSPSANSVGNIPGSMTADQEGLFIENYRSFCSIKCCDPPYHARFSKTEFLELFYKVICFFRNSGNQQSAICLWISKYQLMVDVPFIIKVNRVAITVHITIGSAGYNAFPDERPGLFQNGNGGSINFHANSPGFCHFE